MHCHGACGGRDHPIDKAMCLEKKKIREGFTLDLRQDSPINILCREGDRGLGKGVCCQGVAAEGT